MPEPLKLPLERVPYSGSTDSWIKDSDGKDIARCSCGRCQKCGDFGCQGNVAIRDKAAQFIVDACNDYDPLRARLKKLEDFCDEMRIEREEADSVRRRVERELDLLWSHAHDRVDWFDGEEDVAALAEKLSGK